MSGNGMVAAVLPPHWLRMLGRAAKHEEDAMSQKLERGYAAKRIGLV
jgi:hypothetical protein